jgi:hypothetical protein
MNKLTLSIIISFLLILIMANNIPHGAELYAAISDRSNATIEPIYQGYFVMILFDAGVLVMIFCGDYIVSILLAIFLFIVNIIFWKVPWEIRYWHLISFEAQVYCVWKAILSFMFSFLMHKLSDTLRNFIRFIQLQKRISKKMLLPIKPKNEFECEHCQKYFASKNGLIAHQRKCKKG